MFLVFKHLPSVQYILPPVERRDWEVRVMLNNYNLSEQIRDCLQHAEDCAQKAAAQTDPELKQDFLVMERRWLFLARSYGFTERLTKLSNETKRQADRLPKR
jgi:hypothetical protein